MNNKKKEKMVKLKEKSKKSNISLKESWRKYREQFIKNIYVRTFPRNERYMF